MPRTMLAAIQLFNQLFEAVAGAGDVGLELAEPALELSLELEEDDAVLAAGAAPSAGFDPSPPGLAASLLLEAAGFGDE